ncbi:hypothetical protein CRE_29334 [Caenorhabditis remanei]|uniref:Sdz-33 F-box domain-containing protein n=1 Tax=Caenorhabditis remanei TaxID=31234 RepID=E3MXY5_CAERE|nr:hypothetical protein CRE_29334 [Caenorhabditis remanei]
MNHIRTVFCFTNPQDLSFYRGCERFEVQSLKDTIGNVDDLYVADEKQFNRFVKHWIRGSNPRLQYMSLFIEITNSVSREEPLKGIDYVDVAEEDQLEICRKHRIKSYYMVQIRRKDGTPAVIAAEDFGNVLHVCFLVFY